MLRVICGWALWIICGVGRRKRPFQIAFVSLPKHSLLGGMPNEPFSPRNPDGPTELAQAAGIAGHLIVGIGDDDFLTEGGVLLPHLVVTVLFAPLIYHIYGLTQLLPCSPNPAGSKKPWPACFLARSYFGLFDGAPLSRLGRPQRRSMFLDPITRLLLLLYTLRAAITARRPNVRFRLFAQLCLVGVTTHRTTSTPFHMFIGSIFSAVPDDPLSRSFTAPR